MEDEVDRAAELRQEAEPTTTVMPVSPFATASATIASSSSTTSIASASSSASPPAATTPVLKVMLLPATISEPSPPAPAKTASVARPTVLVEAILSPATMSGTRQRQLHPPQQPLLGQAHAAAGILRLQGHAVEANDDVAEDDLERVRRQRDHRRRVPRPVIGKSRKNSARLGNV